MYYRKLSAWSMEEMFFDVGIGERKFVLSNDKISMRTINLLEER